MQGEAKGLARSVTAGMRKATDGLKGDLRADVKRAGLGQRLANTWRGATYPESGESLEAAAYVSSNAAKLIMAFEQGVTITAQNKKFLAIPAPDAGVKHVSVSKGSKRLTPADWERETGVKLRFVPSKSGGVLVADAFYRRQAARFQRRKSFKPINEGGPTAGRSFVVIFVLVKQAKLRKRLDVDRIAQEWAARAPALIDEARSANEV
nr:DUF6441 family protein [Methylobacterium brachythecii]